MTAQAQPVADRTAWFLPGVRMAVPGIVVVLGGCGLVYVVTHLSGLAAFCNLLAVPCSEQATQQVVNTGFLDQ
jgi:hypothetical protein